MLCSFEFLLYFLFSRFPDKLLQNVGLCLMSFLLLPFLIVSLRLSIKGILPRSEV